MNGWVESLGGLGLFLFGMAVLSSGLRHLAGDRLHRWLERSTRNVLTGAATGMVATALVQSSSAITVSAVGFVGAGLLAFPQALGIIFGANIGTTVTGWMVALVGFELDLKSASLPLMFLAAVLYLFKRRRVLRGSGKALAGFCLVFLGIGFLQGGLAGFRDAIDLSAWRVESWGGRAGLVLVGIVLTLATQSSSATVATALTALDSSILTVPQAAAVVIGADIGTTATALLAAVGGSTAARRTGLAHVIFNLFTGVLAFLILPGYLALAEQSGAAGLASPEVVVVLFHSGFNLLGVLLVLPLARPFARLVERLLPERGSPDGVDFDRNLLGDPASAATVLTAGARRLAAAVLDGTAGLLDGGDGHRPDDRLFERDRLQEGIADGRRFALKLGRGGEEEVASESVFASLHLLDHAERLLERSRDLGRVRTLLNRPEFPALVAGVMEGMCELAAALATGGARPETVGRLAKWARDLEEDRSRFRRDCIRAGAGGRLSGDELDRLLDAQRWLRRVAYHAWRIASYAESGEGTRSPAAPAAGAEESPLPK